MNQSPLLKIALITSQGGHMRQMELLRNCYKDYPHFLITVRNQKDIKTCDSDSKQYFIENIGEGRWKKYIFTFFLKSFWELFKILKCEKPDLIISTGCGIAVPGFILARLMRIKTIYIEPGARVYSLSKTGRICYFISDLFIVQHLPLKEKYPKSIYKGILYRHFGD